MCLTWRMMMSLACWIGFSWLPRSLSSWAAVLIGASGLRSSWASMARNSSLRWLAWRHSDSASFCSWMSVQVPIQRMMWSVSPRIGKARASTQ